MTDNSSKDPLLVKILDLIKQATEERSHFYTASVLREAYERIELLQMPPNKVIELAEADYVDSVALMNALMKKIEGQRKHIQALQKQVKS